MEAAFAQGGDAVIVGDDDQAIAALGVELEQQVDNLVAGRRVEIAGRLVGEEERGAIAQGAGDGDALLFAAGEFRGPVMQPRAEADAIEQIGGVGRVALAREPGGELDIFQRGEFGEKMVGLEHETDGEIAPRREFSPRPIVDRLATPAHDAGVGPLEPAEDLQQRALARAGRALDGVESAAGKLRVEPAQDLEVGVPEAKRLVQRGARQGRVHAAHSSGNRPVRQGDMEQGGRASSLVFAAHGAYTRQMRSWIIGFVAGVVLMILLGLGFQQYVIRVSAHDLAYHYTRYVFSDAEFPWSYIEQGRVVKRTLFPVHVTITYYDADYNVVTTAEKVGRYGAVVKISLPGGHDQYRFITLFHTPEKTYWLDGPAVATGTLPPGTGIDPAVVKSQAAEIGLAVKYGYYGDADSPPLAILLAGLYETPPNEAPAVARTNVFARDTLWWFKLRAKLGLPQRYPYRIDFPKGYDADPNRKWPVIVALHGSLQKGFDLEELSHFGLTYRVEKKGLEIPAIVVSPQLPGDVDVWQPLILNAMLDELEQKYRVDPDRITMTGLSLGGNGSWDFAMAYSQRIAAIAPIAGEGDLADAARLKDVPVWAFEGAEDPVTPPINVTTMIDAIRQAGGHPHLTLYPGMPHNVWDKTYAGDALYTWLLAQKRGQPEVATPGLP